MATSTRQHLRSVVLAVAIGVTFSTPTLADPPDHPTKSLPPLPAASLPPLPPVNGTDDIAQNLLDNARLRLKAGDREAAATLAHDAFELLAASERNGHHPKALSSDPLELSIRH